MANIGDLHVAVATVCPIDGVAIVNPADKTTWRIDFQSSATPAQRAAALTVLQNFSLATLDVPAPSIQDIIAVLSTTQQSQITAALQAKAAP